MKTIEEIKKSVLAYCEEVCPNEHSTAHLEIGMMKRMSMGSVFYWLHIDGLSTIAINAKSTDDHIFAAYRLLGLETRDAVAEKEAEIDELKSQLDRASEVYADLVMGTTDAIGDLKAEIKRLKNREFKQSRYFGYIKAENERLREFVEFCKKSPEKLVTTHFFENGEFDYCDLVPLQDAAELALSPAPVTEGMETESPCRMCLRLRSTIDGYCRICDTDFNQE